MVTRGEMEDFLNKMTYEEKILLIELIYEAFKEEIENSPNLKELALIDKECLL